MHYSNFTDRIAGEGAAAWNLHFAAVEAKRRGEKVILLTIGDPDFASPTTVTEAAISALRAGDTHYTDILGVPALRASVAALHARETGQQAGPENVAIVAGAQGGLFSTALCLLDHGTEAIALEPMYVTYEATIQAGGADLIRVPLRPERDFRLARADLERAISPRTRAIFLATPSNPTGIVMNRAELEIVAELAKAHDLWVVADEVYSHVVFDGRHESICALPGMAERTVTINSLSKSHAMTGWRIGWMVGPAALIQHVGNLGLCMHYGSPPFIQKAAIAALDREIPEVDAMRQAYRRRRDLVTALLSGVPGLSFHKPQAGMFMLIDARGTGLTAADYAWALFRATGVAVLDATAFGASAAGHVRVSFASDEAELEQACKRIAEFTRGLNTGKVR